MKIKKRMIMMVIIQSILIPGIMLKNRKGTQEYKIQPNTIMAMDGANNAQQLTAGQLRQEINDLLRQYEDNENLQALSVELNNLLGDEENPNEIGQDVLTRLQQQLQQIQEEIQTQQQREFQIASAYNKLTYTILPKYFYNGARMSSSVDENGNAKYNSENVTRINSILLNLMEQRVTQYTEIYEEQNKSINQLKRQYGIQDANLLQQTIDLYKLRMIRSQMDEIFKDTSKISEHCIQKICALEKNTLESNPPAIINGYQFVKAENQLNITILQIIGRYLEVAKNNWINRGRMEGTLPTVINEFQQTIETLKERCKAVLEQDGYAGFINDEIVTKMDAQIKQLYTAIETEQTRIENLLSSHLSGKKLNHRRGYIYRHETLNPEVAKVVALLDTLQTNYKETRTKINTARADKMRTISENASVLLSQFYNGYLDLSSMSKSLSDYEYFESQSQEALKAIIEKMSTILECKNTEELKQMAYDRIPQLSQPQFKKGVNSLAQYKSYIEQRQMRNDQFIKGFTSPLDRDRDRWYDDGMYSFMNRNWDYETRYQYMNIIRDEYSQVKAILHNINRIFEDELGRIKTHGDENTKLVEKRIGNRDLIYLLDTISQYNRQTKKEEEKLAKLNPHLNKEILEILRLGNIEFMKMLPRMRGIFYDSYMTENDRWSLNNKTTLKEDQKIKKYLNQVLNQAMKNKKQKGKREQFIKQFAKLLNRYKCEQMIKEFVSQDLPLIVKARRDNYEIYKYTFENLKGNIPHLERTDLCTVVIESINEILRMSYNSHYMDIYERNMSEDEKRQLKRIQTQNEKMMKESTVTEEADKIEPEAKKTETEKEEVQKEPENSQKSQEPIQKNQESAVTQRKIKGTTPLMLNETATHHTNQIKIEQNEDALSVTFNGPNSINKLKMIVIPEQGTPKEIIQKGTGTYTFKLTPNTEPISSIHFYSEPQTEKEEYSQFEGYFKMSGIDTKDEKEIEKNLEMGTEKETPKETIIKETKTGIVIQIRDPKFDVNKDKLVGYICGDTSAQAKENQVSVIRDEECINIIIPTEKINATNGKYSIHLYSEKQEASKFITYIKLSDEIKTKESKNESQSNTTEELMKEAKAQPIASAEEKQKNKQIEEDTDAEAETDLDEDLDEDLDDYDWE